MALCLAVMSILVFGNVVLRYLFNSGITWSEEMSRYFFVFMIFVGSISAMLSNRHISVDLLLVRLRPAWRRPVQIVGGLLTIGVLGMLIVGCWELAMINARSAGPATGFPIWMLFAGGLAMGAAMLVVVLRRLWLLVNQAVRSGTDFSSHG